MSGTGDHEVASAMEFPSRSGVQRNGRPVRQSSIGNLRRNPVRGARGQKVAAFGAGSSENEPAMTQSSGTGRRRPPRKRGPPNTRAGSGAKRKAKKQQPSPRASKAKRISPDLLVKAGAVALNSDGLPQLTREFVSNKLFHSVTNQETIVQSFNAGYDSDGEDGRALDDNWYLRFREDLLHEFVDMFAVEKLFMNFWNQFLLTEFTVLGDRDVYPALQEFLRKYGPELKRMKLEILFVRHVTMLSRCGLVDADGAESLWKQMKNTLVGSAVDTRFRFAVRMLKDENFNPPDYTTAVWPTEVPDAFECVDEDHFNTEALRESIRSSCVTPGMPSSEPDSHHVLLNNGNIEFAGNNARSPVHAPPAEVTHDQAHISVIASEHGSIDPVMTAVSATGTSPPGLLISTPSVDSIDLSRV